MHRKEIDGFVRESRSNARSRQCDASRIIEPAGRVSMPIYSESGWSGRSWPEPYRQIGDEVIERAQVVDHQQRSHCGANVFSTN